MNFEIELQWQTMCFHKKFQYDKDAVLLTNLKPI